MQPGNKQQGDVAVVSVLESDLPCPSSPASGLSRGRTEARAARRCGRSHAPLSCLRSPASLPGLQAHPREHGGQGSGCGGCPQGLGHHGGSGDACLEHLPASRCFRPKSQEGAPASVRAARHPAEPALPACSLTRTHVQTPRHTHHTHVHANTHVHLPHTTYMCTRRYICTQHTRVHSVHTPHTHMYKHMCTVHACVYTNTCTHTTRHIHVYTHVQTPRYTKHTTYTCTNTHVHTIHTYVHTQVYIPHTHLTHTHTHSYKYTYHTYHIHMCTNTHVHIPYST